MFLYDVNIVIGAHNKAHPRYAALRRWFELQLDGGDRFGMSELVLAAYLRIVTNPRGFNPPEPLHSALARVQDIIARPNCMLVRPGASHFRIFTDLCRVANAKANLVSDAYLAALAIEHGCRWYTFVRDFARFPGLDWAEPELTAV